MREDSGKESYGRRVPAVDQSVQLLFALANLVNGEATLTELARDTGIGRSKALALLNTLRFAGLVIRNDQTKRYRLGLNILVLSRALINQTDLAREAIPYLEELATETGCYVHLGVISGDTVYVIARRQVPACTYTPYDVGTRYPVTFGAHGRAILASLSPDEFEIQLARDSILEPGQTGRDPITREVLRAQVDDARRLGYGLSIGTTWTEENAVSVVLSVDFPGTQGKRQAVACLFAVGRFSVDRAHEIGVRMREMALDMSRTLDPLLRTTSAYAPLSGAADPLDNPHLIHHLGTPTRRFRTGPGTPPRF
jgi:DNA-binding IclR family transcriptional regulator